MPAPRERGGRAFDVPRRQDAAIGDQQRPREAQLARELADTRERAFAEHEARAQVKVERPHHWMVSDVDLCLSCNVCDFSKDSVTIDT